MSMRRFDCSDPVQRQRGLEAARSAVRRGALIVLPTDTVYGVGCDAFSAEGVEALLAAKGRGRDMPVPVLVGSPKTLEGIAVTAQSAAARALVQAFWPGGLTLVYPVQPSLRWDLGETRGTVAVRMPLHPVAIELLQATGPMAVSSANISGRPPAADVDDAMRQLGDEVAVYLDGGAAGSAGSAGSAGPALPSTIVDVTGERPRLLRAGAVPVEQLRDVAPDLTED